MSAIANVAPPDQNVLQIEPLPTRTPGVALAESLAQCPGVHLWSELRRLLPLSAAIRVYEAAATAVRSTRA